MTKLKYIALFSFCLSILTGCVNMPVASYTPQQYSDIVKYDGQANIGQFSYMPFEQGRVKSNQIENTALGAFVIEGDIAELAQRGTMLELERTGIKLGNAKYTIVGRIKEFKLDDLGFNTTWSYMINYKLINAHNSSIVLDKDYRAAPKTAPKLSMTLTTIVNDINSMIYSGYTKFISDHEVRKLLSGK